MHSLAKRTLKLAGVIAIASGFLFLGALVHEYPLWFFGIRNLNTPRYFPDPTFRNEVERYMGVKPGQPFSEEEASIRKESFTMNRNLYSGIKTIQSLEGIEYLKSLEEFHCTDYSITEMDLRQNKKLITLSFHNCTIWKAFFPKNIKMKSLSIHKTHVATLNLSDFPQLEKLEFIDCGLTSLDLSKCPQLQGLDCSNNRLSSLDLTGCPNLQRLVCDGNLLTSLNLSNLKDLRLLCCGSNQLTSLDISQNSRLTSLYCSKNQIAQIKYGSIQELKNVNCVDNRIDDMKPFVAFPWLCICNVENNRLDSDDSADLLTIKTQIEKLASENPIFTTDFTYSPQPGIDPYILPATR